MTHAIALLAKAFIAHRTFKWLGVVVDPEVILEVAHLFEYLFAIVDTAYKKLAPPHCRVIRRLNVEILGKRVYRFYGVVCKQRYDSF